MDSSRGMGFESISRLGLNLMVLSLAVRVLLAAIIPLGTDEAYAVAVGRSFSLSFFDHPPISFWLPALMEALFTSVEPVVIRLPSLILGTLTIYFFYRIGYFFGGEKCALISLVLFGLSPVAIISGVLMLPDAPLYFGLAGAVLVLLHLSANPGAPLYIWLLGGGFIAFALSSKYQAGLFVVSVFIWILVSRSYRGWLLNGYFWLAVLTSSLGLLPVLIWNLENDWASFRFHTGRAGGGVNPSNFVTMLVAQAIYVFPTLFVCSVLSLLKKENWKDPGRRLLLFTGLLPLIMFNPLYLFSSGTLPHWTLPGWIFLIPLAGLIFAKLAYSSFTRWFVYPAMALQLLFLVAALHLKWGVFTALSAEVPKWDDTAPLLDHSEARFALAQKKYLQDVRFVVANNWIDAGHLAVVLGPNMPIKVVADAKHHFEYMRGESLSGETVLLKISTLQKSELEMKRLLTFARTLDPESGELDRIVLQRGRREYFVILVVSLEA